MFTLKLLGTLPFAAGFDSKPLMYVAAFEVVIFRVVVRVKCISFGAPVVGNRTLAELISGSGWGSRFIRVLNEADHVPKLLRLALTDNEKPLRQSLENFLKTALDADLVSRLSFGEDNYSVARSVPFDVKRDTDGRRVWLSTTVAGVDWLPGDKLTDTVLARKHCVWTYSVNTLMAHSCNTALRSAARVSDFAFPQDRMRDAITESNLRLIPLLLAIRADINSALLTATQLRNEAVADWLLASGALPDAAANSQGESALSHAINTSALSMVTMLLNSRDDPRSFAWARILPRSNIAGYIKSKKQPVRFLKSPFDFIAFCSSAQLLSAQEKLLP